MKTILITGASGYLAHRLLPIASEYGRVVGVAREARRVCAGAAQALAVDITDAEAVRRCFKTAEPDVVIHAAAANPGTDEAEMAAVNHLATAMIGNLCRESGVRLVTVSTDMVFAGEAAPYADSACADPINEYGRSKALGESAVADCAAVVRTSLIYGLQQMDRGTAGFAERIARGETLRLFNDVIRQPVWVDDLARALCRLGVEFPAERGYINVAGRGSYSRAGFGLMMLRHWGIDTDDRVEQVSGAGIEGLPPDLRVVCDRATVLGFPMSDVDEVLRAN